MVAVANVTKQGIHRSATGVIDAIEPLTSTVTVKWVQATSATTQRIYFPKPVDVKAIKIWRNGSKDGKDIMYGGDYGVGYADESGNMFCTENIIDSEDPIDGAQECYRGHSDITCTRIKISIPSVGPPTSAYEKVAQGVGYVDLRTTVDNTGQEDRWLTITAYGGDLLLANKCWTLDDLGSAAGTKTVTGLGATAPSMTYISTANISTALADYDDTTLGNTTDCNFSYGVAINNTGTPQSCYGVASDQSDPNPIATTMFLSKTKCLVGLTSGGSASYTVTAGNWANGQVDLVVSADASNAICGGLSLTWDSDVQMDMVDVTIPTSADYTQTGVSGRACHGEIIAIPGISSYDTATQAAKMSESVTHFDDQVVWNHTIPYISGVDSFDTATRATYNDALQAYESASTGVLPTKILLSTDHSINTTGWSFSTSTRPSIEIKGRAVALIT